MYGVIEGIQICDQNAGVKEARILASRNVPSEPLEPSFGIRPMETRRVVMPTTSFNQYGKATVPMKTYPTFTPETVFAPTMPVGPWSGFVNNIDHETQLRTQCYANNRCPETVYVPESGSDLYLPDPTLAPAPKARTFPAHDADPCKLGTARFNNATRVGIKSVSIPGSAPRAADRGTD